MNTRTAARTVVLTGATGFIGAHILREWQAAHPADRLVTLTHSDASAARLQQAGTEPIHADLTQPGSWQDVVAAADVVIHAAQPAAGGGRVGRAAARAYGRRRLAMDENLVQAVQLAQAAGRSPRLIYLSGNSYFGDTGTANRADETMTRNPTGFGPYIEAAVDRVRALRDTGADIVIAYPGAVYGDGAWFRQYTLDPMRTGRPVMELRRSRTTSPVHVDDVARAVVHLAQVPAQLLDQVGRDVFVVDDQPVTFHEINETAARALGVQPAYRRVPEPLMRLFAGSVAYGYLATDASYSNRRLVELGYRLTHPTIDTGIPALLTAPTKPA